MRQTVLTIILLVLYSSLSAADSLEWDTVLLPGDKVCIYDIGKKDPLVVKQSDTSLKYLYRSPLGKQQWRHELRPSIAKLLLVVVWPGMELQKQKKGLGWFSGTLFVIKGGQISKGDANNFVERGANKLLLRNKYSWVMNNQLLHFKQVRLKKKKMMRSCYKKHGVF